VALTRRKKLAFACVPLLLLLGLGEALARAFRERQAFAPVAGGSYRDQRNDLIRRAYPAAHDDVLGYVPRPGFASAANRWGVMVSIDQDGLRRNGDAPRPPGRGVLRSPTPTRGPRRSNAGCSGRSGTAACSATASRRRRCAPSSCCRGSPPTRSWSA
jgi:hypothetical protein